MASVTLMQQSEFCAVIRCQTQKLDKRVNEANNLSYIHHHKDKQKKIKI